MLKQQNGITLVALVITVIVLLILAGVAMSMITGEDGIFQKAAHSADKFNQNAIAENERLDSAMTEVNKYFANHS